MLDDKIEELDLFQAALELEFPWYVRNRMFHHDQERLDIYIGLHPSRTFTCSVCQTPHQPFYDIDTQEQVWRHLDFWKYKTFLHAPHPRVQCSVCQSVKRAHIPWTRYNCSFTLEFEHWVLQLVKEMPVKPASRLVREHDTRLWRIVHHYVDRALEKQDLSSVRRIAVDETSAKRGHNYVTVVLDSEPHRLVFATTGKDRQTMIDFSAHLSTHQGKPEQIEEYCSDMSAAFISGMAEAFPKAKQTIDKFHIMKLLGDAVDETRRKEQRQAPELKKTRYLWLRNERDLSKEQQERLANLSDSHLKTAKAYQLKLAFQEFWKSSHRIAPLYLQIWYAWAIRSRIPDVVKAAKTIRKHAVGILRWFETKTTNGLIEAQSGLIQAAKRKARGYRTTRNLIAMIYLIGAKFDL